MDALNVFTSFLMDASSEEACALRCIITAMALYVAAHVAIHILGRVPRPKAE